MPNLNVKGETSRPSPAQSSGGGGGGGSKILLTIIGVIITVAVVAFILNTTGVVKLWGKKKPAPVVVDIPTETQQPVVQETVQPEPQPDTLKPVEENSTKLESNATAPSQSSKKTIVTGTGMYTIQVSSWEDEKNAKAQADIYSNAGFETTVDKMGGYYRVCVGRFESRKEAKQKAESIVQMFENSYVIAKLGK
jgi:hypothetical protein